MSAIPYIDNPQRIVSLVPSQTELLHHLGLEEQVVGITRFCVHPDHWFRSKTRIGGTKSLHLDKIRDLQPQLILANKEENQQEQVEALMQEFPVWTSDIHTLENALDMIRQVGRLTGRATAAAQLSAQVQARFAALRASLPDQTRSWHAAYFIWRQPWMVAGGDTFIHSMLAACGLQNIFAGTPRYPKISLSRLPAIFGDVPASRQLVLLSSEPYPFKEQHIAEITAELPHARVLLADGEMFSWYGSRLLEAPAYFRQLFSGMQEVGEGK